MKYEIWEDRADQCYVFFREGKAKRWIETGMMGNGAVLLHTIEADSWEEACKEYHEFMGWEPYTLFLPRTLVVHCVD